MRKSTWAEGPGELRRRAGAPQRASHLPTLGHANGVDLLISQPEVAWRIKEAASERRRRFNCFGAVVPGQTKDWLMDWGRVDA